MSLYLRVKKASPPRPDRPTFPVCGYRKDYEAAGASAISVLTEPEYF